MNLSLDNGNNNNNNDKDPIVVKPKIKVIDTKERKTVVYSFVAYYFIMSGLVGAPLPFPSLIDVSAAHVAAINFLSLLVTLVGSIIGVGFYVERRNNIKFEQQNAKIDRIDQKIEKKTEYLHQQLREMENRLYKNFDEKMNQLDKSTEYKVQKAKDIEDERFRRIDEQHREHERRLDAIDRRDMNTYYNPERPNKRGVE